MFSNKRIISERRAVFAVCYGAENSPDSAELDVCVLVVAHHPRDSLINPKRPHFSRSVLIMTALDVSVQVITNKSLW